MPSDNPEAAAREECLWCDRPRATLEDWETYIGGEGEELCWNTGSCEGSPEPVIRRWKDRALKAEDALRLARKEAGEERFLRGVLAYIHEALCASPEVMTDQAVNQCAGIAGSAAVGGPSVERDLAESMLRRMEARRAARDAQALDVPTLASTFGEGRS